MPHIVPTVGRVVWYHPAAGDPDPEGQPFAAIVAYVHNDRLVNLLVINHDGHPVAEREVQLAQDGDFVEPGKHFCEWMPYQKGQAAKTEALESNIAGGSAGIAGGGLGQQGRAGGSNVGRTGTGG